MKDRKTSKKRKSRRRRKKSIGSIDLILALALFVVLSSPATPYLWFLLPVSICLVLRWHFRVGMALTLVSFVLAIFRSIYFPQDLTGLDSLSIVLFFSFGVILGLPMRYPRKKLLRYLIPVAGATSALGFLYFLASRHFLGAEQLLTWSEQQINAEIFPYFFREESWQGEFLQDYQSLMRPVLRNSLLGWFGGAVAMMFFMNLVLIGLAQSFRTLAKGVLVKRRDSVWEAFTRWKTPDYVVVLLVVALGLTMLNLETLVLAPGPWQILGWNLLILAIFPVWLQGLAVAAYAIPRVSFWLMMLIFLLLILNPLALLVLAGIGDLWFDFRRRIGSNHSNAEGL